MIIKRKLFNEKSAIPKFIHGETETGRRYVVLVNAGGKRRSRQYIDPYKKRTAEELEGKGL